jgi:hypothetical protein
MVMDEIPNVSASRTGGLIDRIMTMERCLEIHDDSQSRNARSSLGGM